MPQDTFTLRLITRELGGLLKGGKINKIIQPNKDEIDLIVYTGKTYRLILNTNASDCGAYFGAGAGEAPLVAPNFCMLLRKHVQGAAIEEVAMPAFERILRFTLRGNSEFSSSDKFLYLEVMGKYSNLILTDEHNIILGALKMTSLDVSTKRMIFPGVPYLPPASQEKADPSDKKALRETLSKASGDLGDFLFSHVAGLAPITARRIAESYTGGDLTEYVYGYIFSDMVCPCVTEKDGVPTDFHARDTAGARRFSTLAEAQTYFYSERSVRKKRESEKRRMSGAVNAAVKKHEKRLSQILEKREECKDAETLRMKGELLTANLYLLSRGMKGCELINYYDGTSVKISLDARLTPSENAQSYFKRYRKAKRTLESLVPQEEAVRAELDYLQSLAALIGAAESEEDFLSLGEELEEAGLVKKTNTAKKKKEIPYRTFEKEGFTIYAGRNNLQNDRLVRSASSDDLWLHTQKYHSCHVIIKRGGREVPREVKQYAADICAAYSDSRGDRVPVDICEVRHVKKPKGAKAGFVTYSEFTTLAGNPQALPARP